MLAMELKRIKYTMLYVPYFGTDFIIPHKSTVNTAHYGHTTYLNWKIESYMWAPDIFFTHYT